jgi:hypothetical protein
MINDRYPSIGEDVGPARCREDSRDRVDDPIADDHRVGDESRRSIGMLSIDLLHSAGQFEHPSLRVWPIG